MTRDQRTGVIYGIAAYSIWGLVPLYFMAVQYASATEVLAHRVAWSVIILGVLLLVTRQLGTFLSLSGRQWCGLALSSVLLSTNWLVYVWGLFNGYMIETSLGYYINPLVTVMLGVFVLSERPSRLQWIALAIAGLGVGWEIAVLNRFPWVALSLAFSFGLYGLVRKLLGIPSLPGLAAETLMLLPFSLGWLVHLYGADPDPLAIHQPWQWALLGVGGIVTIMPLLAFAAAALRVPLTILGFLQYLSPTLGLILAIFVFDQKMHPGQLFTFACIWCALLMFSLEGLYDRRTKSGGAAAA